MTARRSVSRSKAAMLVATALVGATLVFSSPSSAGAITRTYPGAAPCNTTLQACINGSASGDIVEIATNTPIDENLTINKALTLKAAAGFDPVIGGSATERLTFLTDGGSSSIGVAIRVQGIQFLNARIAIFFVAGVGHNAVIEDTVVRTVSGTNGIDVFLDVASFVRLRDNVIQSNGSPIEANLQPAVGNEAVVFIESNRLSSPDPRDASSGIELDFRGDSSSHARIYSNLIHRTAGCNCGGAVGIDITTLEAVHAHVDVVGNTIDKIEPNTAGISIVKFPGGSTIAADVFNNVITRIKGPPIEFPARRDAIRIRNGFNDFFDNSRPPVFGGYRKGPSTLSLNPRYRDPGARDYMLRKSSPLIDRGLTCNPGAFSRQDEAMRSRLAGGDVDIGAYEFGAPPISGGSVFVGDGGADNYTGTEDSDIVCGQGGPDTIDGGDGRDVVYGGKGGDTVEGGLDGDRLFGGPGPDDLFGNEGDDILRMRDGREGNDSGDGGPNDDRCIADRDDTKTSC